MKKTVFILALVWSLAAIAQNNRVILHTHTGEKFVYSSQQLDRITFDNADIGKGYTDDQTYNTFVKEIYLTPEFQREKQWVNVAIQNIVPNQGRIKLVNADDPSQMCYAWRWCPGSDFYYTCSGAFIYAENLSKMKTSLQNRSMSINSNAYDLDQAPHIKEKFFNEEYRAAEDSCWHAPLFSWVDDDFTSDHYKYHDLSHELGIPLTYALCADRDTAGNSYLTSSRYQLVKQFQDEGHEFVLHPYQQILAPKSGNPTQEDVEQEILQDMHLFDSLGIAHNKIIVYPAFSGNFKSVVNMVKKHCIMGSRGVDPGMTNEDCYYSLQRQSRFNVLRIEINLNVLNKTQIKALIDRAALNKAWFIFETHAYTFSSSMATDETSNTLGNLKEILQYAMEKGKFCRLFDGYNERKPLLKLNDQGFTHGVYRF